MKLFWETRYCKVSAVFLDYLHGSGLMIAYEWRPPLNGDWLRQRHSAIRFIPREVLQAARVGLFLPVLNEQMGKKREDTCCYLQNNNTQWKCLAVILPAVLPLQKRAWSQSRLVRSPPPQHLWPLGWSEALRGSVPLRWDPVKWGGGKTDTCHHACKVTSTSQTQEPPELLSLEIIGGECLHSGFYLQKYAQFIIKPDTFISATVPIKKIS